MAAELVLGALASVAVEKLLSEVVKAASLAMAYNKKCEALHTLLKRLQPMVQEISTRIKAGKIQSKVAEDWLGALGKQLEIAKVELGEACTSGWKKNVKRLSTSKNLLEVTKNIRDLVDEAGIVGVDITLSSADDFKSMAAGVMESIATVSVALQQDISRMELALCTRHALQTPTSNFGSYVGTTTPGRALFEIKSQADNYVWGVGGESNGGSPAAVAIPRYRRQDSETVFGGSGVVENVIELLLLGEEEGGRWVGVWAMGGAGKTLTAQRIYNSSTVQSHFTGGAFWLTVGRNTSIERVLQSLLAQVTGRFELTLHSKADLKDHLCHKLRDHKKVLLVLDDVWDHSVLDFLDVLPPGSGSKIFVTTRNVELLESKHAKKVQIPLLPPGDSWNLFCWHAFRGASNAPANLQGVAREVADECKGLPLALKVIGAALAGKQDVRHWQLSLEKLKNAEVLNQQHEQQLLMRLQLSVDDLGIHPHLRDCFLYFAAFPEGAEVKVVEDMLGLWLGERIVGRSNYDPEDEAYELLGWLIARSLIELHTEPGFRSTMHRSFMRCKVHDVLRDLALYLLQNNMGVHTRECLYKAGRQLTDFPQEWLARDNGTTLSVRRLSLIHNNLQQLPPQLSAPHLQVLLLRSNPIQILPRGFVEPLRSLKVLDLRETGIRELPSAIASLKSLLFLNLSMCLKLEKIPDSIGHLKSLEHLHLADSTKLASIPSSLGKLAMLQQLNTEGCVKLWDERGLFSISRWSSATLKDLDALAELTELKIASLTLKTISATVNLLTKLRVLQVSFPQLVSFPGIENLTRLEVLSLRSCRSLKALPSFVQTLTTLVKLDLSDCQALCNLPSLDELQQLKTLDLTNCQNLSELPESFARQGAFLSLEDLAMYGCDNVARFPALAPGAMPQLLSLNLSGWTQLSCLPASIKHLSQLRSLSLGLCLNLKDVDGLSSLTTLEELDLSYTKVVSELPSLPKLRKLNLYNCSATLCAELQELVKHNKLSI